MKPSRRDGGMKCAPILMCAAHITPAEDEQYQAAQNRRALDRKLNLALAAAIAGYSFLLWITGAMQ